MVLQGEDADGDFLITAGSSSGTRASDAPAPDNTQVKAAIHCGYPQDNFNYSSTRNNPARLTHAW